MLYEISIEYEWEIEALEVMEDHVHMFVSCPPKYSPAQVMNIVKSLTARRIFEEYPQIRKKLWGGRIWADGYYVGSSGEHVTSELIRRYIEYQKQENQGPQQMKLFDLPLANPKRSKRG